MSRHKKGVITALSDRAMAVISRDAPNRGWFTESVQDKGIVWVKNLSPIPVDNLVDNFLESGVLSLLSALFADLPKKWAEKF